MMVSEHATLAASWCEIYRVNPIQTLTVTHVNVCNCRTQQTKVSICAVKPGESPNTPNSLLWDYSLNGNDFKEFGAGVVLVPGMSLQGKAAVANVVNCKLCGNLS